MSDFTPDNEIPDPLPRVKYYTGKEAYKLYAQVLPKSYFNSFSSAERKFRCNKRFLNWSEKERDIMLWYLCRVEKILRINAPKMVPRCWNLAKLSPAPTPYWDLPFSVDKLIVLPESVVCNAVRAYDLQEQGVIGAENPYVQQEAHIQVARAKNSNNVVDVFHTLFHELAHIYLRLSCQQNKLTDIYARNWGMERMEPGQIHISPEYANRLVTNPDTYGKEGEERYLFHVQFHGRRASYLPLHIVMPKTGERETILVEMHEWCPASKQSKEKWSTTDRFQRAIDFRPYTILFNGMNRQLYHPEEILVNFMSDYVVNNVRYIENDPASVDLYQDIDRLTGKNNQ